MSIVAYHNGRLYADRSVSRYVDGFFLGQPGNKICVDPKNRYAYTATGYSSVDPEEHKNGHAVILQFLKCYHGIDKHYEGLSEEKKTEYVISMMHKWLHGNCVILAVTKKSVVYVCYDGTIAGIPKTGMIARGTGSLAFNTAMLIDPDITKAFKIASKLTATVSEEFDSFDMSSLAECVFTQDEE